MSDSDFDQVFGRRPSPKQSFAERFAPGALTNGQHDSAEAMVVEAAIDNLAGSAYKAFGFIPAGTINPSCEVRSWVDGTDVPDGVVFFYRLLMRIDFTGTSELRLMLPDCVIVITGRNLEPLRQALTRQQATYIQQNSIKKWSQPSLPNDPNVNYIEVIRK